MPMNNAEMKQVNEAIKSGNITAARRLLKDSDDPRAAAMLEKLDAKFPPLVVDLMSTAPLSSLNAPRPGAAASPSKPKAKPKTDPFAHVDDVPDPNDIEPIRQAIREKRYEDAEALLILSDHPDAEKLRSRLEAIRGGNVTKTKTVYVKDEPDFNNKLVLCIVLLFLTYIPGLIALEIFAGEARQHPNAPGAQGILITRKVVWFLTILMLMMLCSCGVLVNQVSVFSSRLALTLQAGSRHR